MNTSILLIILAIIAIVLAVALRNYSKVSLMLYMLMSVAHGLPDSMFFFDESGKCIWANKQGLKLLGLNKDQLGDVRHKLDLMFPQMAGHNEDWCGISVSGDGDERRYYQVESQIALDRKTGTRMIGRLTTVRDNTEAQRNLEIEQYNARHDSLTGLYNKEHLFERIEKMLRENPNVKFQVAYVDVNEFKLVNDVFGREFGDLALKQIGEWVAGDMPEMCLYGRLGGDTFGVCQPIYQFDPQRINQALTEFKVSDGKLEHHVLIQLGIYEVEKGDTDVSIMFDRARMALNSIKRTYAHISYYDDKIRDNMLKDRRLSNGLDKAIKEGQIRPYLQPIVNADGKVAGAEALVRWAHPEEGLLPPDEFIPIFESNGRIVEIDKHMWRCAGEILAEWKESHPDYFISINISPRDFYFMDVAGEIEKVVVEYGIDPSKLRLEITESVMVTNMDEHLRVIERLRKEGHVIEVDDFGSGYSSFNILKDIPADLIKLDRMFLQNAEDNEKARIILERLIKMIDDLGLISLTEGVETERQFNCLKEFGCMLFQGYHFSRPLPPGEFEQYCEVKA